MSSLIAPKIIEQRISSERLRPYRLTASGDLASAIAIYEGNAKLSGAFWEVLSHVEVVIRNAMHDQLTTFASRTLREPRWYLDTGALLNATAIRDVEAARARAVSDGRPETPGQVVAELSLGFWRFLLAVQYDRKLWLPCLRHAFPHLPKGAWRRDAYTALTEIHHLRNRIAHHEPIHNRRVGELHQTALTLVGWICPDTRLWIEGVSRVPSLLSRRP